MRLAERARARPLHSIWPVVLALSLFALLTTRFVHDYFLVDDPLLLRQQCMRPEALRSVWTSSYFAPDLYRPLTAATLCLDYERAHANPTPYYVTNALLMLGASVSLGLLARALFGPGPASWLAASFYLVFPVCVRTTSWIYGRGEHLVVLFSCLALALWLRYLDSGRRLLLIPFSVLLSAALLSKETALFVALPAAFLLFFRQGRTPVTRSLLYQLLYPLVALAAPPALYLLIRNALGIPARLPVRFFPAAPGEELSTLATGLPVQSLRGTGSLILSLKWPEGAGLATATQDFRVPLLAGVLLLGATALLAVRSCRRMDSALLPSRRVHEVLSFSAIWIVCLSYPVYVGDLHEHYTMAPTAGWIFLVVIAVLSIRGAWRHGVIAAFLLYWAFLAWWRIDMSRAKSATELSLTRKVVASVTAPEQSVALFANFHPRGNPFLSLYSPADSLLFGLGRPVPYILYVEGWPQSSGARERQALAEKLGGILKGRGRWDVVVLRFDEQTLDVATEKLTATRAGEDLPVTLSPP
jgi:hypothetical protein